MNQADIEKMTKDKAPELLHALAAKVRADTLEEAAQAGEKLMDMPAEHEGAWNTAIRQFAIIVRALKQQDV